MENKVLLAIVLACLLVISCFALGYAWNKPAEIKIVPVTNTVSSYNDTAILADISVVKAEVTKDNTWKTAAEILATTEMNEREYRNVFNALVDLGNSIVDKEDIQSVKITEQDVDDFDVDEKDATVVQELKVYYEDADGDNKKAYLTLTTEIVDGEVTDFEYELTVI